MPLPTQDGAEWLNSQSRVFRSGAVQIGPAILLVSLMPALRALNEKTYFAGLRKAGLPEE
jgi:hypothetical protein